MTNCYPPLGSWPFGFAVESGYPKIRQTSAGPEAEVVFIGPSLSAMPFLEYIFGRWSVEDCCAIAQIEPKPFPLWCPGNSPYQQNVIYPDTWSYEPADSNCIVRPMSCGNPLDMTAPFDVVYKLLDDSQNPTYIRGFCALTIMYRYKGVLGDWPEIIQDICYNPDPDDPENCPQNLPDVEPGTFIEVTFDPTLTEDTVPAEFFNYRWIDQAGPGGVVTAQVNTAGFQPGVLVKTNEIQVTWGDVPIVPWSAIYQNEGKVNNQPIFGYPKEAVLFSDYKVEERPTWYGVMLYRVTYTFHVKVVDACPGISYGIGESCRGKVGTWNRQIASIPEGAGGNFGCHYIRIETKDTGRPIYELGTFMDLFSSQVNPDCPQPPHGKCVMAVGLGGLTMCVDGVSQQWCTANEGVWTQDEVCNQQNPLMEQAAVVEVT